MKKCRRCSKPATLHITEIRKGEVQQLHLCEVCAKDYLTQADAAPGDESPGMEFDKFQEDADALDVAREEVVGRMLQPPIGTRHHEGSGPRGSPSDRRSGWHRCACAIDRQERSAATHSMQGPTPNGPDRWQCAPTRLPARRASLSRRCCRSPAPRRSRGLR